MADLPKAYEWLAREPGPRLLTEALALYGVREKSGPGDNPVILDWAKQLGIKAYTADSIPWCGLFMAYVAMKAGWPSPLMPLWARNWSTFGREAAIASLGDVLVFSRGPKSGHVGLYVGEDRAAYHVLGGNQGDAVSIVRIQKGRLLNAREPRWRIATPPNRRRVFLGQTGVISKNEA